MVIVPTLGLPLLKSVAEEGVVSGQITSCGLEGALLRLKPFPCSVPASYTLISKVVLSIKLPSFNKEKEESPTNQSGLGASMLATLTR